MNPAHPTPGSEIFNKNAGDTVAGVSGFAG
jgi:hypothetical protein